MSDAAAVTTSARPTPRPGAGALLVGVGILLSRLSGLVRTRVLGHYLGIDAAADAYAAALRIPNFLQNLLGEGVLSASFIPVYASLRARGPEGERDARRVAGAVAGLLGVTAGLFALLGSALTPWLIELIAPGFHGETRALAIRLVRIFFPGVSLLVLSAFCLGVQNSHRRFLLSYVAPVLWNAAIVAALLLGGRARLGQFELATVAAWGMVAGSALQLSAQLPTVLRLLGGPRAAFSSLSLGRGDANVRSVAASFFPVLIGRGVVQISGYVDTFIASWLPTGALAAIVYAQTLYMLPVSLFGMAISAAALPAMSAAQGEGTEETRAAALREQLAQGLRHIAFPVIPSAVAFLALGDVICAALFQTGRFSAADARWVWAILAGSTVGLLAQTMGRLYSSTYYALRETRAPLRYAVVRVALTAGLGVLCALWLPKALGLSPRWGAVGLTASAGVAGQVEFYLLKRGLRGRIGEVALDLRLQGKLWAAACAAGLVALGVRNSLGLGPAFLQRPWPRAFLVLGAFGLVYLAGTLLLEVPEAQAAVARVRRLLKRR